MDSSSTPDFLSKAVNFWTDLPNHYQYASFGGAGLIALLILLAICLCCCRRKRKLKKRRHGKQNGHGQTSLNGSLLLNSSANGGVATNPYYHKLNGGSAALMSAGQQSNAAFELSSLLPQQYNQQPPSRSPPGLSNSTALVDNCSEPLPEVPFDRLEYGDPMGEGQFGTVYRGTMRGYGAGDEATLEVAIKTLKDDLLPRQRSDFVKEIRYMCRLRHQNVVELIGVCNGPDGEPNLAVFEYMIHGDLHDFLMLRAPSPVERYVNSADVANGGMDMERVSKDHADFLNIAVQVACGMEYLASMCYVHRDLAARNCLVSDHMVIKIADFGLMRPSYEKDYYQMQHRTMMPVRWMPPEALIYGQFSEASDVWAFGVTLWEIYSYGRQPHEGYTNGEVIDLVRSRNLLEAPRNAPTRMYSLMVECWHENPSRRPRFAELHGRLQTWAVMGSPAQSSAMSAPYHHQQQRHHQPGSTHSGGSSTAQQGRTSRQSSVPSSSVLLNHNNHNQRSVVNGTSTVPITTNGGYVPPPAPMPIQTMLTLNGVHPYHNGANGRTAGKSAVDTSSSPMMRDNCSPMTRKQQQQQQAYHYSEDGEDDSSD